MSNGGTIRCDSVWPADDAQNAVVLQIARDASGMPLGCFSTDTIVSACSV